MTYKTIYTSGVFVSTDWKITYGIEKVYWRGVLKDFRYNGECKTFLKAMGPHKEVLNLEQIPEDILREITNKEFRIVIEVRE